MTTNTGWKATETVWGEAAYQEIKAAFPGKLKSRSVALCVWCYAQNPDITEEEIEAIARTDAEIVAQRQKKRISSQGQKRAKALLGLGQATAEVNDPNLSRPEQALLTNFRKGGMLVEEYQKCERRLQRAEKALEKARLALQEITPQNARNLADVDDAARRILGAEGLLTPAAPTDAPTDAPSEMVVTDQPAADPAPPAVVAKPEPAKRSPQPAATERPEPEPQVSPWDAEPIADDAFDILHKKVTTAANSSLGSVDDAPNPFANPGEAVHITDDFYSNPVEEHPEEFYIVWPDDEKKVVK
jgi:hypothetical protein